MLAPDGGAPFRVIECPREQRHGVHDLDLESLGAAVPGDLHETSGIARGDDAGAGLPDTLHLPEPELGGDAELEEAIDPRAPAAELAVRELQQRQAGNPLQDLARPELDPLPMNEMTG